MNKKIASEIAIGLILLVVIIFGALFFLNSKKIQQQDSQQINNAEIVPATMNTTNKNLNNKINTKFGYDKSMELIGDNGNFRLIDIYSIKDASDAMKKYENKIRYSFESDSKKIYTLYDYENGAVVIEDELIKNDNASQPKIIPASMVAFGVESVLDEIEKSDDYVNYKKQYPQIFDNYIVNVRNSDQYGWEFGYVIRGKSESSQSKMLVFTISPETKKVTLIKKVGFDAELVTIQQEKSNKIYKSEKYSFSLQYPADWSLLDNDSYGGPILMKPPLTEEILRNKGIDGSGCAIPIKIVGQDSNVTVDNFCKNKLGVVTFGNNTFTKCSFTDVSNGGGLLSYAIKNTKSQKLLDFSPVNTNSCLDDFAKIASSLSFE